VEWVGVAGLPEPTAGLAGGCEVEVLPVLLEPPQPATTAVTESTVRVRRREARTQTVVPGRAINKAIGDELSPDC
jgi:hypothetical protein